MQKITGILIGRFQPLHAGHRDLIAKARAKCDHLIIIVGSANSARTIKNPFTFSEREKMIWEDINFKYDAPEKFTVLPINDYKYSNSQWISDVNLIAQNYKLNESKVVLFGHFKDGNDYLKWFPEFGFTPLDKTYEISGTQLREAWFKENPSRFAPEVVEDYNYFKKEAQIFSGYPFPETLNFNCADVIVECAGHILLIQRANVPGRGTWALVGGFRNSRETFVDCAIRELLEEVNIRVPEKVLRGSIVNTRLFDNPYRGMGIPRNSLVVHIKIEPNPDGSLPRVSPKDETMAARWILAQTIMNDMKLFDDHTGIISVMCNINPLPAHINSTIFRKD